MSGLGPLFTMDAAFAVGDGGRRRGDGDAALREDNPRWSCPVLVPKAKVLKI